MEVDRSKYYEPGRLNVAEGPLGQLPTVGGETPVGPEPGLRVDNFVCNGIPFPRRDEVPSGREPCRFYAAVLLPADGVARGFGEMKQIRRFCLKMATASELFELDGDVFACTLRDPQDQASIMKINDFEARQRQLAEDMAETSGELDF
jgi:hypothetical protein